MAQINEKAVWERVSGEKQEGTPIGPVLMELINKKREDARSYRLLAGKFTGENQRILRLMSAEVGQQVRSLEALFLLQTGKNPEKQSPAQIPKETAREGLCRMLRREDGSSVASAADRCVGQSRETLLSVGQQDARRFQRLLQMLAGTME